ncbi:Hypothetical protein PHPALM_4014 [Phytophthora palmivora]|uniref:Uncharacterized protein n=1 Tax=Phytophthora palmivora TaxID=4796 RepID=A0A2P4YKW2_9STRA|nr:Hypothetical protein PHPALM_4014 [Phytophthora palmivora]
MDFETSSSVDESIEYENSNTFDYINDSDEEECGLADAFMQFEAQAEKRTQELLNTTDEQLFRVSEQNTESKTEGEEESHPSYVYMSDQFRLKKPPQFQHWQHNFQYLQVTGSRMLVGESMEHVQLIPMKNNELREVNGDVKKVQLQVEGRKCLQEPTVDCQDVYEEIILCDGLMEENLDNHEDADDEMHLKSEFERLLPHRAHVEEVLDALTMECFSSTVAPTIMLEKQQNIVRTARKEREAAANRTIEEQVAFEKARQLQLEQEALKEAARIEALEQQRQEEERKETERREQLLKQQLEENDEEEVKIKTLAYSHTREWYQPNKKCFLHRGRQL